MVGVGAAAVSRVSGAVLHDIHLNFSPTDIVEWDDVAME